MSIRSTDQKPGLVPRTKLFRPEADGPTNGAAEALVIRKAEPPVGQQLRNVSELITAQPG